MKSLAATLASFTLTNALQKPTERFLKVDTDHFAAGGHSDQFEMRYLVNDEYWDPATGPILFYSGNEGDIYSFYDNSGFMTETVA
jgi:dipeptidyl-peptidase-2